MKAPVKVRIQKKKVVFICIIGVIILFIVFLIMRGQNMFGSYEELDFSAQRTYVYTGTGFLCLDGSEVMYYDTKNNDNDYTGNLDNADVSIAGYGRDNHVVYDAASLCIIGHDEVIAPGAQIKRVECGEGFIACLTDNGSEEKIHVYDTAGQLRDELEFKDSVTDFGFTQSDPARMYAVSLNTDSSVCVSQITTYNPSVPAITGIITVQEQLIEDIIFTDNSVFVEGTHSLIRYDAETNKESYRINKHGYRVYDEYAGGSPAVFIMSGDDETRPALRMYIVKQDTVAEERIVSLQVPSDTVGVIACKDGAYVATPEKLMRFDKTGTLCETQEFDDRIDSIEKLSEKMMLLHCGNKLYTIEINDVNFIKARFG